MPIPGKLDFCARLMKLGIPDPHCDHSWLGGSTGGGRLLDYSPKRRSRINHNVQSGSRLHRLALHSRAAINAAAAGALISHSTLCPVVRRVSHGHKLVLTSDLRLSIEIVRSRVLAPEAAPMDESQNRYSRSNGVILVPVPTRRWVAAEALELTILSGHVANHHVLPDCVFVQRPPGLSRAQ
jgi:hypothetical protein